MANVLRNPHRAVLRNAERTRHHAQVDVDQFARILHSVGVERGNGHAGHRRGDRPRIGITTADHVVERLARRHLHRPAACGPEPFGECRRGIVEALGHEIRRGMRVFRHPVGRKFFQYDLFAIHCLAFFTGFSHRTVVIAASGVVCKSAPPLNPLLRRGLGARHAAKERCGQPCYLFVFFHQPLNVFGAKGGMARPGALHGLSPFSSTKRGSFSAARARAMPP